MNKKGFTLIELLAVIVILAIIALIATPIVVTLMDKSEASAAERSADSYLKAVDIAIGTERLNGRVLEGDYDILENGNLCPANTTCTDATDIEIDMNGQKPSSGTINIKEGVVTIKTTMQIGDYVVSQSANGKIVATKIEEENDEETDNEGENEPTVTKLCTANKTKAKALVWVKWSPNSDEVTDQMLESSYETREVGLLASDGDGDAYAPGVAYTCNFIDNSETNNMTFFVLSSTANDVTLISGSNLGGTVAWGYMNNATPVIANAALADRTSTWNKLNDEQRATIKLPTTAQILGAFDNSESIPTWLISFTKAPVAAGYWTSTPYSPNGYIEYAEIIDYKYSSQGVFYTDVPYAQGYGVRPVITISKEQLN